MDELQSATMQPENSEPPAGRGGRVTLFGLKLSPGALVAWIALLALLVVLALGLIRAQEGPVGVGQQAPDFTLQTFDGQTIHKTDLEGKVVLVNFWASWCKPCEAEAADLQAAWRYYQTDGEVVFLGVDYVDTESAALKYINKFNITYPNGPDLGTKISQDYRMSGVPESYIIGRDGVLAHTQIGVFNSVEHIRSVIDPLLEQ